MNEREKLIEEADKAYHEVRAQSGPGTGPLDAMRAALAVFEKAHTPTDDERIVRASIHGDVDAIRALGRLLRRTEVPEPSRDPGWSHPDAVYSSEVFGAIQELLNEAKGSPTHALRIAVSRQLSEPQRGPSDDGHLITDCEHGVNSLYDRCAPCEASEQGEPSDAQVDAVAVAIAVAANADYWTDEIAEWENAESWEREAYPDNYPSTAYEDREEFRKQARAALRAASEATN